MKKIFISTSSFDLERPEIEAIRKAGYDVMLNPHARRLNESEISQFLMQGYEGILAGVEPLTRKVLTQASGLKVISRCGAGLDNVDLQTAREHGILVFNTPDAPTPAVAEMTIALVLDCLRSISFQDRAIRAGRWDRPMGRLLGSQTVGIIGYGRIGQKVKQYLDGFGAKTLIFDPYTKEKSKNMVSFEKLIMESDIITLHTPFMDSTRGMIDQKAFSMMKKGVILINTARGGLVNENALYDAVVSGHVASAGLDVFEDEPYGGSLRDLDRVILTAHTGSYAHEARSEQERMAAVHLLEGLLGIAKGNIHAAE